MLGWVRGAEWDESLEKVMGGVRFLTGGEGRRAPGPGVAGWTPSN